MHLRLMAGTVFSTLTLALGAGAAFAQSAPASGPSIDDTNDVDRSKVTVTATRVEQATDDVPATVSVITYTSHLCLPHQIGAAALPFKMCVMDSIRKSLFFRLSPKLICLAWRNYSGIQKLHSPIMVNAAFIEKHKMG